ncbi:MAG: hypothetical protein AAF196_10925 [Planctomycetota bacterium]
MPAQLESARKFVPWLALMAPGCALSEPPAEPLDVPAIRLDVLHYFGDPLSGPTQSGARMEFSSESASAVRCSAYYLENAAPILEPLASRLDLVIGMLDHRPVLPSTTLAASARVGVGIDANDVRLALNPVRDRALVEPFGRVALLGSLQALAPLGGNAVFDLSNAMSEELPAEETVQESGEPTAKTDVLSDPTDDVETTLIISQVRPAEFEVSLLVQHGTAGSSVERQLMSLEDAPVRNGGPLILLLPSAFEPDSSRAIAFVIEATSVDPNSDLYASLASECEANLEQTARELTEEQISAEGFEREAQNKALDSFILEGSAARLDLIYAIEDRPVAVARDLAISGSDSILDEWSSRLQYLSARPVGDWALTASALLLLLEFANQGDGAPELDALLVEHAGQLGRRSGQLRAIVDSTVSIEDWRSTILMENFDSLRDSDPSARVRAFDWLRARGIEVDDYDPLGGDDARRAALRAHRERAEREENDQ